MLGKLETIINNDEEVFSWDRNNKSPKKVAENFEEYICNEIVQGRKVWEE